ncbi:hypothetical protein CDAR_61001 [Caerostris darwini]|uniref:Ribosomal protein S10 n=1 Tax=Caerostris darwini TaxID=1538125 RepID=A0AAV4RUQ1_9ARAC|nr:hypothetical protein CDAR_61001 [Caerostris darwini]
MFAALRHFVSSLTLIRSWIRKESSLRMFQLHTSSTFIGKREILYQLHAPLCRDPGDMVSQNIYRAALELLVKSIKVDKWPVLKQKRNYLQGRSRIFLSVGGWK